MKIGDKVYIKAEIDEIRKDTIICKNEGGYFGTVESEIVPQPEPCEDCINREDVLYAIRQYHNTQYGFSLIESIENKPSVKPARTKRQWVNTAKPAYSDNIVCENCGYDSIAKFPYCPNCGAEMEVDDAK